MTTFPNVRAVSKDAGVDRVLVSNKDITWFRATGIGPFQPTAVPGYQLTEPFAYGSSEALVIPRTNSLFERYGQGDLAWLKKGAPVKYQRVTDDGTVTDYVGIIWAIRGGGPRGNFVAEIGGALSSRADKIDKQPVLIRKVYDLGLMMKFALDVIGFTISPANGPVTGLTYPVEGGMTLLGWMQKLGALSQTAGVAQRSLMPKTWGGSVWEFKPKDTTTVDFTAYADGQRIGLDLVDDLSEQPNTIFGSGVTPEGERWRGSAYPGFFQGPPAPYPFDDTSHAFGEDTTDDDTDTGDGITVMRIKLAVTGFLNDRYSTGSTYDANVAAAVDRLKDRAGLTVNGIMTAEAWDALWDAEVVGFSDEGAIILPLAQAAAVRYYNRSSTGSIIGLNDQHRVGTPRVDRTIDFGVCDEGDARNYAQSILHTDQEDHQWVGTVTLNSISVFSGDRDSDYADAFNADPDAFVDDMMVARDIRPGMNGSLPYFDGGTLVHVSTVDVSAADDLGNRTVTLTVDTGAKDHLDLVQARARNRESGRNVYREWIVSSRGVKAPGNFTSRDKWFGKLDHNVELTGGQWNVVPFVMGQSGTVGRVDVRVFDDESEFCMAMFSQEVTEPGMNGFVGNPFSTDGDGLTVWEHEHMQPFFDDRNLLYLAGKGDQPCGYSWMNGYDDAGDRTAVPLSGRHLDGASWGYISDPRLKAICWMAIWPKADCTLRPGRLFCALEDDAT